MSIFKNVFFSVPGKRAVLVFLIMNRIINTSTLES